jgi:hypothetical protein
MLAAARPLFVLVPLLMAGCGSSAPSLPKLNMFGSSDAAPATTGSVTQAPAAAPATPEQRAAQVGATSARAVKCGYNFDPARLKANYMAAESQGGLAVADLSKVEKAYDTINVQVARAIAGQGDYCTESKTQEIKADLTRHLSGDYSPPVQKKAAGGGGLFGNMLDTSSGSSAYKPLTADSMWEKTGEQRKK